MFQRLSNSWELVKASWQVLRADKELVIFPIISFIGVLLVGAAFFVPMVAAGMIDSMFGENFQVFGYIILFVFYVVTYTVTIFANSALVGATMIRLDGGDPTVSDGFRIARKHLSSILGYAVIAATVGLLLKMISERSGALGKFVISLIGMAWNLATFLVVPVLVVEGIGPMDAVKRSAELLKRTWGEQIAGNFGIGTVFGLLFLAVILVCVPLIIVAVSAESISLIITIVVLMILALAILGLISSTLSGIYAASVYRFATTGDTGGYFDAELVKATFKKK